MPTTSQLLQRAIGDAIQVRELIGRGGFAEVYAGWDVRLKREVAIKTIRPDVASVSLFERFQREAEAVAQLRHPHIIPIYSVGEANGIAYFVMPRISGESLAAALEREKRIPVGEACRILSEAAGALEEAHRAGVIHRDIKPENIMLEGRDRRALVMDFGIAKSAGTPGEKGLTGTGMVMGTPQYMSPEQAAGDRALDHRSDQYSLAMIGYRMLSGQLPFESDSLQTMLVKQVTQLPPPLRSLAPDVPEPVAAAIERALSKRPEDRFPSMAEFGAALSVARDAGGATRAARALPLPKRIARVRDVLPRWRHPLTIAGLIGALVFLILAPQTISPVAIEVAKQKDDALFAARSLMAGHGVTGGTPLVAATESRAAPYDFLRQSIPGDSIDALARAGVPIWLWHIRAGRGSALGELHVDVGHGGRVSRFERTIRDSVTRPVLTPEAAESLAVAALTARGWDMATLTRIGDSTATLRNRVDRYLTWRRNDLAVGWSGADSAYVRVQVRVSGDTVTDYTEWLSLPREWVRQRGQVGWDVASAIAWLLAGGLLVYALVQAIARQRDHAIQWRPALVITGVTLAFLGLAFLPVLLDRLQLATSKTAEILAAVGLSVFIGLAALVAIVFSYATGESMAAEADLPIADGVADLTRGRLAVPELALIAPGMLVGLVTVGLWSINAFAWTHVRGTGVHVDIPGAVRSSIPLAEPLMNVAASTVVVIAMFFLQVALRRWTKRDWPAIVAPALAFLALFAGSDSVDAPGYVVGVVIALLTSFSVWRYGLLAGIVTMFVTESAWPVLVVGMTHGASLATLVAVLGIAAPLLLARAAYQRTLRT